MGRRRWGPALQARSYLLAAVEADCRVDAAVPARQQRCNLEHHLIRELRRRACPRVVEPQGRSKPDVDRSPPQAAPIGEGALLAPDCHGNEPSTAAESESPHAVSTTLQAAGSAPPALRRNRDDAASIEHRRAEV